LDEGIDACASVLRVLKLPTSKFWKVRKEQAGTYLTVLQWQLLLV
jgi:hypothetical protein